MLKVLVWIGVFLLLPACVTGQQLPAAGNGTGNGNGNGAFEVLPVQPSGGASSYTPLTNGEKFAIAARRSFRWQAYLLSGAAAGIRQARGSQPSFGGGMAGYGRRYGWTYNDRVLRNMTVDGLLPVLLNEDPRYFHHGPGPGRLRYALMRTLVTRTDSGHSRVNFSALLGNPLTVGLSNAWYPDSRTARDNLQRLGLRFGVDALSNVIREYWPDIRRRVFHRSGDGTTP